MIRIINIDEVVMFDEYPVELKIAPTSVAKKLPIKNITKVEFLSIEKLIIITVDDNLTCYFYPDAELLDYLCETPKFRSAIKRYCIRARFIEFNVTEHSSLTAAILGDNASTIS